MKDLLPQQPFNDAFPDTRICGNPHKCIIGEVVPVFFPQIVTEF